MKFIWNISPPTETCVFKEIFVTKINVCCFSGLFTIFGILKKMIEKKNFEQKFLPDFRVNF